MFRLTQNSVFSKISDRIISFYMNKIIFHSGTHKTVDQKDDIQALLCVFDVV